MKKIFKKEYIIKGAGLFLIVTILLFSNLSAATNIVMDISKRNTHPIRLQDTPTRQLQPWRTILDEDFSDGNMPPEGPWGTWEHNQTNSFETWEINDTYFHSSPYSAYCQRDENCGLQNESLITPSLNFSGYTEIYLSFYWFMERWSALIADYYDLNVSISTDNGSTWEFIWSEDHFNTFNSWWWYDTNKGDDLDLSHYSGNTSVKIRFQYIGKDNQADMAIDDILIYGDGEPPDPLECDSGGPYYGWASYEVKFNGSVSGGEGDYTYLWDFGDNTTNSTLQDPVHIYNWPGVYEVSLTVKDKGNVSFDNTFATIYQPPTSPPSLMIREVKGALIGIVVKIKNHGGETANFSDVRLNMEIQGGILGQIKRNINRDWPKLTRNEEKKIRSWYFPGFGIIDIKISLTTYGSRHEVSYTGFKFGPVVII